MRSPPINGVVYGLPQDAEARPFFFWKPHHEGDRLYRRRHRCLAGEDRGTGHTRSPTCSKTPRRCRTRAWCSRATASIRATSTARISGSSTSLRRRDGRREDRQAGLRQGGDDQVLPVLRRCGRHGRHQEEPYRHCRSISGMPRSRAARRVSGMAAPGTMPAMSARKASRTSSAPSSSRSIPAGEKSGKPNTLTHPLVYLLTKQADEDDADIAAQLIDDRLRAAHQRAARDQLGASGDLEGRRSNIPLYSQRSLGARSHQAPAAVRQRDA